MLEAAAAVTGGAMLVGAIVAAAFMLQKQLGAFMPLVSLVRIVHRDGRRVRGRPRSAAARQADDARRGGRSSAVVFLVVLVASRELGKRDLEAIKAVRQKRGAGWR